MMDVCRIYGCEKKHHAKGFCQKHYRKYCVQKTCSVDGCDGVMKCKGLCNKHYHRLVRLGTLELPERSVRICGVEGCEKKHMANGVCANHYQKYLKHKNSDVYNKRQKRHSQEDACKILKAHEEEMKDDPERLNPTFLRELVMIDCDDDLEDV